MKISIPIKDIYGIEAFTLPDGQTGFHVLHLQRSRKGMAVKDQWLWKRDLKMLTAKIPVALCINTKLAISKPITGVSTTRDILQAVLPGAETTQFWIDGSDSTGSVIRKDAALDLIDSVSTMGFDIIYCRIGVTPIGYLTDMVPKEELALTTHRISIAGDTIQSINAVEPDDHPRLNIRLGSESFNELGLPAFAVAALALDPPSDAHVQPETVAANAENFRQKKLFETGRIWLTGFVFILLLISYLVFSHYTSRNEELRANLGVSRQLLSTADSLRAQLDRNRKLLGDQITLSTRSHTSFLVDRLSAGLPASITLKQVTVFPDSLTDIYRRDDVLPAFYNDRIYIKGNCTSVASFNNWKQGLPYQPWVTSVKNLSYKDVSDFTGEFEIELYVKPAI